MKIQGVFIDGFKNLSNIKMKFDSITALVATNNFGKSNVLSGIDFGVAFIKADIDSKNLMVSNKELIPINKMKRASNYKFEMELLTELNGKEYNAQYGYEFSWNILEDGKPEIIKEFLKVKLDEKGQKYKMLINRDKLSSSFKKSETGRCSSKINVEPLELIVNKLRAYDNLYYSDIIKKINSIKIYMENNLDAKEFYMPDPFIRKGVENEMINIGNLPRVIFNLKKENPGKYELLKNITFQLFPNIEDFFVREVKINLNEDNSFPDDAPFRLSNSLYFLNIKDKNLFNTVDISVMSDGVKRVFMILTKIIVSNLSNVSLIAIEEPENSIHPSLFNSYIQIIEQLLDGCKVIITSHSPYIISYLNPSWIRIGVNRKPGIAEFFPFKKFGQKQLEKDAFKYSTSIGDYLFSILSDSEEDMLDYLECDEFE